MRHGAIYHLGNDVYVEWSSVVDAPVSALLTRAEVVTMLLDELAGDALGRLDELGHTMKGYPAQTPEQLVAYNRAGPKESCLTLAAILRLYAKDVSAEDAVLTPEDINPFTCDDDGVVYWIPWRPGEGPETLDTDTDLHTQVPLTPEELAALRSASGS